MKSCGMMKVVAANVAVALVGLVLLELVFGSWLWGASYGRLNLPRNVERVFDVGKLYPADGPVVYTRDGNGLRGAYPSLEEIEVLVLGGSTTNELYVGDGHTWVDVLRHKLAEAGRPAVVVNAGVDGQSTLGHIYNFEVWFPNLKGLKPKVVLAYVGINDMNVAKGTQAKFDAMLAEGEGRRWWQYVENHSALVRVFEIWKGMAVAREARVVHGTGDPYAGAAWARYEGGVPAEDDALRQELADYRVRLLELARRIGAWGAKAIFITQPLNGYRMKNEVLYGRVQENGAVDVAPYFRLMAFNRVTMDVCGELGLTCFDLGRELEMGEGDFYDYVHTTVQGSGKVGGYVGDALLPYLIDSSR
ncbi:MAG: SGNH/GDSL hydrolase family protein [Pseudomonadaceae bacterium]|nr:SGNH/GDSL hydrolase family protein [Pseudomonadaceae bacterium]